MEPRQLHPDLTWDRLQYLAAVIVQVNRETALMHQPEKGDNAWSLGCRAYARSCYAFARAYANRDPNWLKILPSETHFVIMVGHVPVRFYSGDPKNPPARALKRHSPELEAAQYALFTSTEYTTLGIVRLIVEKDQDYEVVRVSLVNLDQEGRPRNLWTIPLSSMNTGTQPSEGSRVVPLTRKNEGVNLPPADVRPPDAEEAEEQHESN